MEFSNWLKSKLSQKDIKASELAYRSKISDAEISRLLSDKRKPSAKTIKKIAPILHVTEEEALRAAGYLPPVKEKPKTITIPIHGECPADKFNFAFEEILDTIEINWDFVKDESAFALRVKGDCLKDIGIFNKDIVIVSPQAHIKNGDIVVARVDDECTMKKFLKTKTPDGKHERIILQPCNHDYDVILIDPKNTRIEIIGKVIRALKIL